MAHIHEKIDFTVAIFVVHNGKVLLIHHRKQDKWLPLGGHIELDEDPEMAALREAKEESGLEVELVGERPPTTEPGTRALIAPRFLDIHRITETHEHIGLIYWARPKNGTLTLASAEHHDIRWCGAADLDALRPPIANAVKWYCCQAMAELKERTVERLPLSMNRSKRAKRLGVRPVLWRFEMGGERKSGAAAHALQDASRHSPSLRFMVPMRVPSWRSGVPMKHSEPVETANER